MSSRTFNWDHIQVIEESRGEPKVIIMADGTIEREHQPDAFKFLPCNPPMRAFILAKSHNQEDPPDGPHTDGTIPCFVVGWKHNVVLEMTLPVLAGNGCYPPDELKGDEVYIQDASGLWLMDTDEPRYETAEEVYERLHRRMSQHDLLILQKVLGVTG